MLDVESGPNFHKTGFMFNTLFNDIQVSEDEFLDFSKCKEELHSLRVNNHRLRIGNALL